MMLWKQCFYKHRKKRQTSIRNVIMVS